ncbi:hypothetical protein [Lederbergia lenta]|uniref:hypothetical protein n=1 Tax=Lederbergia lenta TaxID=1467 RepID=UPI00203BC393|nr:hypothetical protein [Lederbergia lenta]MCM3111394.1 hypothetical protein [Lederbergia lenta]
MEANRKKIIISEINFWKQNNMLPEHYCDYLLTLYTEGENNQEPKTKSKKANTWITDELIFNSSFLLIIILSLVLTYFTHFSFSLQTVILTTFFAFLFGSFVYYLKRHKNKLIIYITTAFLLLLYMVQINETFFQSKMTNLYLLLLINCSLWIVFGIWRKVHFFTITGFIAVAVLLFYILT